MKRMPLILIISLMLSLCFYSFTYADKEIALYPYIITSAEGRYYFKMPPDPTDQWDRYKGFGAAYKVALGETDKKLWTTEGWYAFSTFLSCDGTYLVRLGNWPRGHKPSEEHLAIAFYKKDRLIKSYSTRDLIGDGSKVRPTVSHYQFWKRKETLGFIDDYIFQLLTVDDIKYKFDIRSGDIVSKDNVN